MHRLRDPLCRHAAHQIHMCMHYMPFSHGQLGHGGLVLEEEPRVVEALWGVPLRSVAAGGWHSACIGGEKSCHKIITTERGC